MKLELDAKVVRLASGRSVVDRKLYDVGGPDDAFFGVALSLPGRDTDGGGKDDGAVLWLQP